MIHEERARISVSPKTSALLAAFVLVMASCGGADEVQEVVAEPTTSPDGVADEPLDEEPDEITFPTENVELVNPYPGGTYDLQSRTFAPIFEDYLPGDETVGVLNIEGGAGIIGYNDAWNNPRDGHRLTIVDTHNMPLLELTSPDIVDWSAADWQWLGGWFADITGLAVHSELDADDWQSFIELGQEEEGAITFGTVGDGTRNHGFQVLFAEAIGIEPSYVHYATTADVRTAMGRREINAYLTNAPTVAPWIEDGEAKWIGMVSVDEHPIYSDVPTLLDDAGLTSAEAQELSELTASIRGWATGDAPEAHVQILRDAFWEAANDATWLAFLDEEGTAPAPMRGEDMQALVDSFTETFKASMADVVGPD